MAVDEFSVEHFVQLERQVWQALIDGDPAADAAALSEDFFGVYTVGYAGRELHAAQLENGPTVSEYTISEEQIQIVSDVAVMLTYRADYRRPEPNAAIESMYVSSLWCLRNGRWLNTFSQDTPIGGVDPP